jgi:hypothetical protein
MLHTISGSIIPPGMPRRPAISSRSHATELPASIVVSPARVWASPSPGDDWSMSPKQMRFKTAVLTSTSPPRQSRHQHVTGPARSRMPPCSGYSEPMPPVLMAICSWLLCCSGEEGPSRWKMDLIVAEPWRPFPQNDVSDSFREWPAHRSNPSPRLHLGEILAGWLPEVEQAWSCFVAWTAVADLQVQMTAASMTCLISYCGRACISRINLGIFGIESSHR